MRGHHRRIDDDMGAATLTGRLDPRPPAEGGRPALYVLEPMSPNVPGRIVARPAVKPDPVVGHLDTKTSL